MNRLIGILLLGLLLGPQVGTMFVPAAVPGQESRDCCAPDRDCDVNCVACACGSNRALGFITLVSLEPVDPQLGSSIPVAAALDLPLLPTDILHVPKSA